MPRGKKATSDSLQPSSSLPRRTSSRLARASFAASQKKVEDDSGQFNPVGSHPGPCSNSFEVAIPLKNVVSRYTSSSSTSTEENSGDGTNEYNTPATSVAVTPIESAIKSRKRISASTRARELRSSAYSLSNTQRGVKRTSTAMSVDNSKTEDSDAALARVLQLKEYQSPKRQKPSRYNSNIEVQVSGDDCCPLTDADEIAEMAREDRTQRQPHPGRSVSLAATGRTVIPDSEDFYSSDELKDGLMDAYELSSDSSASDFDSPLSDLPSSEDGEPLVSQLPEDRNNSITRRRALSSRYSAPNRPLPPGMSRRAARERRKLEIQHPLVTSMWDDLKKTPPINPVAAEQPLGISRKLKSYQLEGLNWMIQQENTCYKGGLLGDEMGMGKTIQAVSLLMSDYPAGKPSLVVVPPVALMQWQSEIKEYTNGQLKVLVYHNSNSKVKLLTKKDIEKYDVIMISYSGLESIHRKESKGWVRNGKIVKEDSVIHSIHYHRLVLDEAHSIKQRTTSVARACFALEANYKWCLSGTPVQNRIGEFFSLLRFLQVRPFACYFCKECKCESLHWSQNASKRCNSCGHSGFSHVSIFNQEILNPITERFNNRAREEALSKLRLITDRIMLRRVKQDHTASMELPPKRVILHNEFFGEVERDFSRSIMTNSTRQFDTYVSRGVMLNNYANIFGLIMQMRQVANHPDLILKKHSESGQNVLVCSICDEPAEEAIRSRCHHEFCRQCAKDYIRSFDAGSIADCPRCHIPLSIDFEQPDIEQEEEYVKKNSIINRIRMEDWTSSTKIEMLVYDLYKLRNKKQTLKSIIFSQFTSMLQLVEWRLRRAGFNTVMLDGTMTPVQRQKSIDHFMNNVDVEIFLVSLKAGGVALNLTEASQVFIVDP
ncbi:hypothetical protein MAP00_001974 [Monascus purpureus]|nr:hypothetical protein MAP00_001974 [Monascus purpureus]